MSKYAIKKGPNGKADFTSSKYTLTKNGEIMTVNQAGLKEIRKNDINNQNQALYNTLLPAPVNVDAPPVNVAASGASGSNVAASGATVDPVKAVANSEAKVPSGSNASGASGPSVPVSTPGPSGSVSNAVNQQKLIKVTKDGSNYSATTLESKPVLSESDITSHKSKINPNTQLVKIIQNGTAITGELIQSAPTKGGKYKKHTMKRKAKKSKKTRRH